MPQPPFSLDLTPCDFFVLKTVEAHERTTLCYDWGNKNCNEGGTEQDWKITLLSALRFENVAISALYIEVIPLKGRK